MWLWSWVLTGTGVVSTALAGRRPVFGWGLGLASQGLWVAYVFQTHRYGFLASSALFTVVYGRNWWSALQSERQIRTQGGSMKTGSIEQFIKDNPHPFTSVTPPFDVNAVRHVRVRPRTFDDGAIDYVLLAEVEGVGYAATSWTVEPDGTAWTAPWRTSDTLEDPCRLLHEEHARRLELV